MASIEFHNVSYQYQSGRYALKDVAFAIPSNKRTAIVGANGAGKSTLVLHMNGLFAAQSGEVSVQGEQINKHNRGSIVEKIGIVFQDPDDQLISMTVRDDVAFGPVQLGLDQEEINKRTETYMQLLHITHLAERHPNELSFGQKKMVAIAGVLAMETDVVIFDEPMAFLDPVGKKEIQRVMDMLIQQGKTVIITTHDMQLVAEWSDYVIVMKEGRCLGTMTAEQLFSNRHLLGEAGLHLPPVAELLSAVWNGEAQDMPIRLEDAKQWLKTMLR